MAVEGDSSPQRIRTTTGNTVNSEVRKLSGVNCGAVKRCLALKAPIRVDATGGQGERIYDTVPPS